VVFGERDLFDPNFFEQPHVREVMPPSLMRWYRSEAGQWMRKEMGTGWADAADAAERFGQAEQAFTAPLRQAVQSTRMLHEAGAPLIFGTDTPSGPVYTQFPGSNGYREIQRWAEAGIPLAAILRALTIDNARVLGLEDRIGSVAVGKVADLLLLRQNPLETAVAYDSIETVILRGEVIPRQTLSAKEVE
jgi:imidazolonepropionase-like amidohydrolase